MPFLFHGPNALAAAKQRASSLGDFVGEFGSKIDDIRLALDSVSTPSLSGVPSVVVVGPLDRSKSCDALLKTLEEGDPSLGQIVLWSPDLQDVPETVRSRCQDVFADGQESLSSEAKEEVLMVGRNLAHLASKGDYWLIPEYLGKVPSGLERFLLESIVEGLEIGSPLWSRLRPLCKFSNPTTVEIVACLLP